MRPLLLFGAIAAAPLAAQNGSTPPRPLTALDSLEARRGYEDALRRNPDDSRSVYHLARLTADRDSTIALYRRYTELEPDDPWGWMALGDALLARGRATQADSAWEEAARLAPAEPEVVEGRAGFSARLGRYWLQAGRPRRAAAAFERSLAVSADPAVVRRLGQARALARPAFEPGGRYQRDSDGNQVSKFRLRADLAPTDGSRFGVNLGVTTARNDLDRAESQEGSLFWVARPGLTTTVQFGMGLVRTELPATSPPSQPGPPDPPGPPSSAVPGGETWVPAVGNARFRWVGRDRGPVIDLSGQRYPLLDTPELALNQVMRTEGRLLAEVPFGPIRLRGEGRGGAITGPGETNQRWALSAAMAVPLGWWGEVSLQGHRLSYRDTTTLGYFAPERVETLEAGSYLERGDAAPWTVALDLGAGGQRIQRFGEAPGDWGLALRGWGWITYALGPARALQLEFEGYNAPGAAVVATAPDWNSFALSLSIRWGI